MLLQERICHSKCSLSKPKPIVAIFLTVLIDMLAFGMAIPDIQLRGKSLGLDGWALGAAMASFSLAQLLTAPYLGQESDRIGRRKILLITCMLSTISFILYAHASSIPILIASRILGGIAGANIGVAFAYIADVTTPAERAKGMGLVGAAFGLGFIFGPPIGGHLISLGGGQPHILGYTAAAASLLNSYFVWQFLSDVKREGPIPPRAKNALAANWRMVGKALSHSELRILITLFFMATLAFSNLESTYFRLISDQWKMSLESGGYVLAWVGVVAAFMQGFLIRRLTPKFGEANLMRFGYTLLVPSLLLVPYSGPWLPMLTGAMCLGIANGAAQPSTSSLISRSTPAAIQGGIFGVTQSVGALARVIGPQLGMSLYAKNPAYPYLCGGLLMLIPATLAYFVKFDPNAEPVEHAPTH